MRVIRWLGIAALTIVGFGSLVAVAARFADGPIWFFRSGALAGVTATERVGDWNDLVENGATIQLETRPEDPYSVNIEARIREGRLYSWSAWEHQWNTNVLANPRVVVRAGGTLFELAAVPVDDPAEVALLHGEEGGEAQATDGPAGGLVFRFDWRGR